ncbi:hypothetical protein COEREDRAFT_5650 [Coemansia reversa NRRL 1564]|uniref:Uncharacterized protein n=1 Tax=Coemansia reversa (strain ATCC 12441 / NRRL 1564) TaxID=763665 RepID=A0A2G5BJE1_COERN|nr:hypothetical protein COEREDRAFT_5650 [Coemansia reversa NRRL 1564]|eukprot:PIA19119.1 hypothetical protein COEREDRAFT_5650 [Coemansia reversa NRRL 1564]
MPSQYIDLGKAENSASASTGAPSLSGVVAERLPKSIKKRGTAGSEAAAGKQQQQQQLARGSAGMVINRGVRSTSRRRHLPKLAHPKQHYTGLQFSHCAAAHNHIPYARDCKPKKLSSARTYAVVARPAEARARHLFVFNAHWLCKPHADPRNLCAVAESRLYDITGAKTTWLGIQEEVNARAGSTHQQTTTVLESMGTDLHGLGAGRAGEGVHGAYNSPYKKRRWPASPMPLTVDTREHIHNSVYREDDGKACHTIEHIAQHKQNKTCEE